MNTVKDIAVLLADGCEEVEALTPVDVLRRADMRVHMISVSGNEYVNGSHSIRIGTNMSIKDTDMTAYDCCILPGGAPGYINLKNSEDVKKAVLDLYGSGKLVAAICAAPTVLASFGILEGKNACCYPGMEGELIGAKVSEEPVVSDGNIITSRGAGTAMDFSFAIVEYFLGSRKAMELAKAMVYKRV